VVLQGKSIDTENVQKEKVVDEEEENSLYRKLSSGGEKVKINISPLIR